MADREKAIKMLEHCIGDDCSGDKWSECEYSGHGCIDALLEDALALLKAQEPRVMTLEEAKAAYVIEYRSGAMKEVGAELLSIDVDPANDHYGNIYRVWTSRPTEAEREAVKWE